MFPYLYLFLPAGAVFYFLLHLFPGIPAHPPAAQPSVPLPSGYALSWNDEFGGASLDMEKWFYRQTGPRHDAVNTPEAVSAGNGILSIRTYTENGKHHTGMIATKKKSLDRTYGFYEASIEFTGDRNASSGMWSAFWLQSDTISTVGNTGKYGTEIDIVEYRPNPANGYETNQAIHYHGYGEHHKSAAKQHKIGLLEGYHTYGVLRTAGGYTFYMDGKEVWKTQEALSCIPEYIILSSEIRDKNSAGDIPANGYGSRDKSPTAMNVDYVRVYSLPDSYRTAPDGKWSDRQWETVLPSGRKIARLAPPDGANVWFNRERTSSLLLDRDAVVDSLTVGKGKFFHLEGRDKTLVVRSGIAALERIDMVFDTKMALEGGDVAWTLFEPYSSLCANGPVHGKGSLILRCGSGTLVNSTFLFNAPVTLQGEMDVKGQVALGPSGSLSISGKTVFRRNSRLVVHLDGKNASPKIKAEGGLELEKNVSLYPEFFYVPEPGDRIILADGLKKTAGGTFFNLPEGRVFDAEIYRDSPLKTSLAGKASLRIHYTDTGILLTVLSVDKTAPSR